MSNKLLLKLIHKAPLKFLSLFNKTPTKLHQSIVSTVINQAFNQALDEGEFEFLATRWLELRITDLTHSYFFSYKNKQLIFAKQVQQSDVCFSGELHSLLLLASKSVDPDTLFFQRKLLISGDTELGLEIKNLIDSLELASLPMLLRQPLQLCNRLFMSDTIFIH